MEGCGPGPGQRKGLVNQGIMNSGVPGVLPEFRDSPGFRHSSECARVCVVFVNVALDLCLKGLVEGVGQEPGWGIYCNCRTGLRWNVGKYNQSFWTCPCLKW